MKDNTINNENEEKMIPDEHIPEGWVNIPKLSDLTQNYQDAKPFHDAQMNKRTISLDNLNITGSALLKKKAGRSGIQPKLIKLSME